MIPLSLGGLVISLCQLRGKPKVRPREEKRKKWKAEKALSSTGLKNRIATIQNEEASESYIIEMEDMANLNKNAEART